MDRTAAIIVNYNMPKRADALAEHILYNCSDCDVFLVDNGSDLQPEAEYTNVYLAQNVQTTRGWLAGIDIARMNEPYFAYWFLITSAEFVDDSDTLAPMVELLQKDDSAVGVHPALTPDSTTAWGHLFDCGSGEPRQTWMIDNIASLYRASWWESIGGFDAALYMAHGIDLETCWLARKQERKLYVHEGVRVKKISDIGYTMGRMNMSSSERVLEAKENMDDVLGRRYGPDYWHRLTSEFVTESMK